MEAVTSSDLADLGCEPFDLDASTAEEDVSSGGAHGNVEEESVTDYARKERCVKTKAKVCLEMTPKGVHFKCTPCNLTFTHKDSLRRHNKKHEGTLVTCTSTACTRRFYTRAEMKEHVQTAHMGKTYACEEDACDETFSSKQGMKRHQNEHRGVFRHKCEICGKGFSYLTQFTDHVNKHHDFRPHKCTKCTATFACERTYKFHVTVCGKDPEFECEICGKYFKAKKYMIEHRHVHTSPVNYQCDMCGKCYTHRGGLKKHKTRKH